MQERAAGPADAAVGVQAMVWLGQCLVLATALRYVLFNPRTRACTELFSVSPEAPPPTMVQAAPAADEAILLMVRHPAPRHASACPASAARASRSWWGITVLRHALAHSHISRHVLH